MRKLMTYGRVEDGQLKISYRRKFDDCIKTFPDCRVTVTVEKLYRKRSDLQNSYYWGCVVNECAEGFYETTGQTITKDEAHELLKLKCNGREIVNEKTGEALTYGGTTTELTTVQMMEYWDRCREFIYEWFNRTVPEPNEQTELFK